MSNFGIKFRSLAVRHIATDVIQNWAVAQGEFCLLLGNPVHFLVKSTKSHGIGPTASRWNRSHSKIDVGIGPKFFFAEGGLSPTFWDLFHHKF